MFTIPVGILRVEKILLLEGEGDRRLLAASTGGGSMCWLLFPARKEHATDLDESTCILAMTFLSNTYSIGDAKVTLRRLCRGDETEAGSSIAMQSD